jgi:hypothetical protein
MDSTLLSKNVYTFKDSKNDFMKSFDNQGKELKSDPEIFYCLNDKTCILVYQYSNRVCEITAILNDDFRDYMGII